MIIAYESVLTSTISCLQYVIEWIQMNAKVITSDIEVFEH